MTVLTERVCRTIERFGLLPLGARAVVAASGGADSTALVCLLRDAAPRLGIEVSGLVHFNHMLRGAASDGDEQFCRDMAERLAIGFESGRGDVRAASRQWGTSVEDAGRRLRYQFFSEAMTRSGASHLAVGHTRDDQAETLLLNLVRGAGTTGLSGMPACRGAIVRPLLDCTHQELVEWLSAAGVPYREDESNGDRRYLRNRLRHDVMPVLCGVVPSAPAALARAAEITRADGEYLDGLAEDAFERVAHEPGDGTLLVDLDALAGMPTALARRIAHLSLGRRSTGRQVGFGQVERLIALARGELAGPLKLPGQRAELTGNGQLRLTAVSGRGVRDENIASSSGNSFRVPLSIPGEALLDDRRRVSSELRPGGVVAAGLASSHAGEMTAVLDAGLVSGLAVRFRRPGDRFRPLGLVGHKSLQDFFVDRKVPRAERERTPLVVDGDDRVVWVAGHAVSEDFRVSERTRAVVILKLRGDTV
jgi:tRNA(Ile)-lysidine synthase